MSCLYLDRWNVGSIRCAVSGDLSSAPFSPCVLSCGVSLCVCCCPPQTAARSSCRWWRTSWSSTWTRRRSPGLAASCSVTSWRCSTGRMWWGTRLFSRAVCFYYQPLGGKQNIFGNSAELQLIRGLLFIYLIALQALKWAHFTALKIHWNCSPQTWELAWFSLSGNFVLLIS